MDKTILVVDDEPEVRDLVCEVLDSAGYSVMSAATGREALRLVREQNCDLVLLDIMMPGLSGVIVAELLAQDPNTRDLPVIFLSAIGRDPGLVRTLPNGYRLMSKPFELDHLLDEVERSFSRPGTPINGYERRFA